MSKILELRNKYIKEGFTKEKIMEILEWYRIGRGEDKIRTYFGISQDKLNEIINHYAESDIENKRKENLDKLSKFNNLMALPKLKNLEPEHDKSLSRKERIKNLKETIRNVEEGDERE